MCRTKGESQERKGHMPAPPSTIKALTLTINLSFEAHERRHYEAQLQNLFSIVIIT